MNFKDLDHMLSAGIHPVVTCQKKIEDLENYAEPGMRARIIGSTLQHDDVVKLKLDFTDFDEYNKQFESANYFDRTGNPVLTAREAGLYTKVMDCYVMAYEEMEAFMTVTESASLALMNEYKASEFKGAYAEWLELRVQDLAKDLAQIRGTV
jgi:hypothetical protein